MVIRLNENMGIDEKTQEIRLLDVFGLGPFMIWFGFKAKGMPEIAKIFLIASGVATIIYNGRNYIKNCDKCSNFWNR